MAQIGLVFLSYLPLQGFKALRKKLGAPPGSEADSVDDLSEEGGMEGMEGEGDLEEGIQVSIGGLSSLEGSGAEGSDSKSAMQRGAATVQRRVPI